MIFYTRLFAFAVGAAVLVGLLQACAKREPNAPITTEAESRASSEYIIAAGRVPNAFGICWRGLQFLYNDRGGMVQVRTVEDKPMECKE